MTWHVIITLSSNVSHGVRQTSYTWTCSHPASATEEDVFAWAIRESGALELSNACILFYRAVPNTPRTENGS